MSGDTLPDAVDAVDAVDAPTGRSSYLRSVGLSSTDALVIGLAAFLLVGFFPPLMFDSWTLRMALVLPTGLVGLAGLVTSARRRDVPALALGAYLAWALLASLLSGAVRSSLFGDVGREISWISLALCAGVWSLGRGTGDRCREVLTPVVVIGAAVNATVSVVQMAVGIEGGDLAMYFGRPTGLVTNPVYLGAICAGGAAIVIAADRRSWWWPACGLLCAHAVALSGSRVAVASVVLVGGALLATNRTRRVALRSAAAAVGLATGVVAARALAVSDVVGSRLASTNGGGRSTIWSYGLRAWLERPLQGYGIGQFRPAVQGRFSAEFAGRAAANEATQAWFDPHDIVVHVLATTGIVGLLVAACWLWLAVRSAAGPLAWGAAAIAITWSLQPLALATLPIAMLLLGAAEVGRGANQARPPGPPRSLRLACVAVGVCVAGWLVIADLRFATAIDDFDSQAAIDAAALYPSDPVVADLVAQVLERDPDADPGVAEHWRRRPTEIDPERPLWWIRLARFQTGIGDGDGARESIGIARELQPNSVGALRAEIELAAAEGDQDGLLALLERSCEFAMEECDLLQPPGAGPP